MLQFDMGGGPLQDKDVFVSIRKVGQEHCDPKKAHEKRRWDTYDSLHFVLYGSGTLIADGERIHLNKGDAFLLYANREYEYYPSQSDPWSYLWVDLKTSDTEALFTPCGMPPKHPYVRLADIGGMMGLLKSLYESYDASDTQGISCSGYFLLILAELLKGEQRKRAIKENLSVKQRHIRNILTYINNNYRLPLTTQEIAASNHISVSRMMALFVERVGLSPIAYLNCFRVSMACELLKNTDAAIGDVAKAVGVEDRLYFSRLFKKWKGVSPREYRGSAEEDPFAWLKERNIDFR